MKKWLLESRFFNYSKKSEKFVKFCQSAKIIMVKGNTDKVKIMRCTSAGDHVTETYRL